MSKFKKKFFFTALSAVKKSTVEILCTFVVGLFLIAGCIKDKPVVITGGNDGGEGPNIEHSVWKHDDSRGGIIELTFYPSESNLHIKTTPEDTRELGAPFLMFSGDITVKYCMKDDKMYFAEEDGVCDFNNSSCWLITYLSENEMRMNYEGYYPHVYIAGYNFVCQTEFNEI